MDSLNPEASMENNICKVYFSDDEAGNILSGGDIMYRQDQLDEILAELKGKEEKGQRKKRQFEGKNENVQVKITKTLVLYSFEIFLQYLCFAVY